MKPCAFAHHARQRFHRDSRILAGVVLAMTLLWWPSDPLVYRHLPDVAVAVARWRTVVALTCAAYLLLSHRGPLRDHPLSFFALGACIICATMGYTAGLMGGPERPYFHLLYVVVFGTITLHLRLRHRVLLTALLATATAAGYFIPFPAHRASSYLPLALSFLLCVALVSTWFGHVLFLLSRANFLQAQLLETRVAERTTELRRLLADLQSAREDERTRIARELHDELGQELTALGYALACARDRVPGGAVAAELDEMEGLLLRTRATTRKLVSDLRPQLLDDLGLDAAAEWLVRRTEERTGLRCRLRLVGPSGHLARLPDELRTAAFRVLQESLTNIARHAQARTAEVTLRVEGGAQPALEITVCDDGIGLPGEAGHPGAGLGILGMRERAAALNGELLVRRRTKGGTEVRCRLPLPARAETS